MERLHDLAPVRQPGSLEVTASSSSQSLTLKEDAVPAARPMIEKLTSTRRDRVAGRGYSVLLLSFTAP